MNEWLRPGANIDSRSIRLVESPWVPAGTACLVDGNVIAAGEGWIPNFLHRHRMSEIKAEMRADLDRQLDAFAARWGIERDEEADRG